MKLDPMVIPKFKCKLAIPHTLVPEVIKNRVTDCVIAHYYVIKAKKFYQQMLPFGFPKTELFGYSGDVYLYDNCKYGVFNETSVPGPIIKAIRGIPVNIKWVNELYGEHPLAVDPTICWADPNNIGMIKPLYVPPFPPGLRKAQNPIPIVTHLHGGETSSVFDGNPEAWFTPDEQIIGPAYTSSTTEYLNKQPSANLWYHDHTIGMTRLNVYCGLYGPYIIQDLDNPLDNPGDILPNSEHDIPLVIKDYTFNEDGSIWFPNEGSYPRIHPYWVPEFYGETITVNGSVWPNLDVERKTYRFRVLNGSNARFYNLYFCNNMQFIQIGSDGGYLPEPVKLTNLLIAPGERMDILVDFSNIKPRTKIQLLNNAPAPYPNGDDENYNPCTTGVVMQFNVKNTPYENPKQLPKKLNDIPVLKPNSKNRILVLSECIMNDHATGLYLNGEPYMAPVSETPLVGSTEEWEIVNLTGDAHPIHLHLVQFLIKNRQGIDSESYSTVWTGVNGMPPLDHPMIEVPIDKFLIGNPIEPPGNEKGWKDTAVIMPGEVMRLLIRFAPQEAQNVEPGVNSFPFNPSVGPGYVWHCHIIDHEDNEMMRPYVVLNKPMDCDEYN